jgi:PKD repeat protein
MTRTLLATLVLLLAAAAPADASILYLKGSGKASEIFSLDTSTGRHRPGLPGVFAGKMVVAPDNRTLYALGLGEVYVVDTASNTLRTRIGVPVWSSGIAITPDGKTVLTTDQIANAVTPIATATERVGRAVTVKSPSALAITPDGRTAYVVSDFRALVPIDLATFTAGTPIALADEARAVEITPDGALAVVSEGQLSGAYVQVVDLATATAEPAVKMFPQPAVPVFARPSGDVAIAPDGRTAYVATDPHTADNGDFKDAGVLTFDIATRTAGAWLPAATFPSATASLVVSGDGGRLFGIVGCRALECLPGMLYELSTAAPDRLAGVYAGTAEGDSLLTMVPAPNPVASFDVAPGASGRATSFDAGGSSNDGGTVNSYVWEFGDGSVATTTVPNASHVYADPGTYTVKLTTTNLGGCATRLVYTGQSATCTGSPVATTTRTVTVVLGGATATTAGAAAIRATEATLKGTVGERATSWRFEYGQTTRYGRTTAPRAGTGAVQSVVGKLKPNRTYHYRLVAATENGTPPVTYGADMTFRTATTGTLSVQAKTLRLRGRSVKVALRCASTVACRGKLTLTSGKRTCATGTVRLKGNQRGSKRLTLRRACRKKTSARLTSTVTTGQKDITKTVRIKR